MSRPPLSSAYPMGPSDPSQFASYTQLINQVQATSNNQANMARPPTLSRAGISPSMTIDSILSNPQSYPYPPSIARAPSGSAQPISPEYDNDEEEDDGSMEVDPEVVREGKEKDEQVKEPPTKKRKIGDSKGKAVEKDKDKEKRKRQVQSCSECRRRYVLRI